MIVVTRLNGQQFVADGIVGPFTHGAPTGTANVESGGDGAYRRSHTAA